MIVSFNGDHGSGKSTIAQMVAKKLDYPRYYMGQIFRDIAKEKNITLEELHAGITDDVTIDKLVDDYLVDLSNKEKDFIVESRTAWYFIPKSIKVYFRVDSKKSAERVFLELQKENNRNEGAELDSIKKVEESLNKRKKMDDERYLKFYGINIRDDRNYDLVIDTTNLTIQEVFKKVMDFIKLKMDDDESN
ncbi:MAG: cytidylate kinase family protein [Parcubacteria group bacterium]|jgi:cytidylate kinase